MASSARDVLIRILTQSDPSGVDDISKSLDKIGKTADRVGKELSLKVTAPLLAIGGLSTKFAADAAESASKLDAVFGDRAGAVNDRIEKLRDSIPATTAELQDLYSGIQDLLVPLGLAPDEAENMSDGIVKLAGDLASFNNIPISEALERIRSGLVGQYEPLLKFGVALSANTVKAAAFEKGIGDGKRELTAAERALVSYQLILEGTDKAHGDAARTAGSAANQFKFLRSETNELLTVIGEELIPVITPLISGLRDAVAAGQNLDPALIQAGIAAGAFAAALGPALLGVAGLSKALVILRTTALGPYAPIALAAAAATATLIAQYAAAAKAADQLAERQSKLSRSLSEDLKDAVSAHDITNVIRQSTSALASVEGELADIERGRAGLSERRLQVYDAQHKSREAELEVEQRILQTNIRIAQEQGEAIVKQNQARAEAAAKAEEEAIAAAAKAEQEALVAAQLEAQRDARESLLGDLDLEMQLFQAKIDGNETLIKQLEDQKREQIIINQLKKTGVGEEEAAATAEKYVRLQREARAAEEQRNQAKREGLRLSREQLAAEEELARKLKDGVRSETFIDVGGNRGQRYFDASGRQIDESQAFVNPQATAPQPAAPAGGAASAGASQSTQAIVSAVNASGLDLSPVLQALQAKDARDKHQIAELAARINELGN